MAAKNPEPTYVNLDKRVSFISEQASVGYAQLDSQLADETKKLDSDETTITCAISLETPYDLKQYFSWIAIPSGNRLLPKIYSVKGLKTYLEVSNANGSPDPNRILQSLKHMTTRVNRYLELPESIQNIPATEMNSEFKMNSLRKLIDIWINGKRDDYLEKLSVVFSIGLWFDLEYIHRIDQSQSEEKLIKLGRQPKTFIIRKSSVSSEDNEGDCTVFTISHVLTDGNIYDTRIVDVHGVGLYCVTRTYNKKIVSYNPGLSLGTNNMRIILSALNHRPPTFACFTDLLISFAENDYIDLSKIVRADQV